MTFNEWYATSNYGSIIETKNANIANWLVARFANYELLFDDATFLRLLVNVMDECVMEIAKIDYLEALKIETLGIIQNTNNQNESSANANVNNSYAGYNVEGDFNKQSTTTSGSSNNTTIATQINNLKIIDLDLTLLYDNLFNRFIKLFVVIS